MEKLVSGRPSHSGVRAGCPAVAAASTRLEPAGSSQGPEQVQIPPPPLVSGSLTHRQPRATAGTRVWPEQALGKWPHSNNRASSSAPGFSASADGVQQGAILKPARGTGWWTALRHVPKRALAAPILGVRGVATASARPPPQPQTLFRLLLTRKEMRQPVFKVKTERLPEN